MAVPGVPSSAMRPSGSRGPAHRRTALGAMLSKIASTAAAAARRRPVGPPPCWHRWAPAGPAAPARPPVEPSAAGGQAEALHGVSAEEEFDGVQPRITGHASFVLKNAGQLADFYDIDVQRLGEGAFGSVSTAVNKTTCAVRAVKTIPKASTCAAVKPEHEIKIMTAMDHPNIVKLYETFEDEHNVFLVMELCRGGSLFDQLRAVDSITEKQAASLMRQVFHAVSYMHQSGICHRDLKPENMLLSSSPNLARATLKVIDFGLAREFEEGEVLSTRVGSPHYVAPEVLEGRYTWTCDMWSVGVTAYMLLCGRIPFDGKTEHQVIRRVRQGVTFEPSEWAELSAESQDLVRLLLQRDPCARPSAAQALQHPWVTSRTPPLSRQNSPLQGALVERLRRFHSLDVVSQAALTVSASNISQEKAADIREAFLHLDVDGSGFLCESKIKQGLEKSGLADSALELNTGKVLTYTGFLAAMMNSQQHMTEDGCWSAFCFFDQTGDGRISSQELRDALCKAHSGGSPCDSDIIAFMRGADQKQAGVLDFQEFKAVLHELSST